LTLRVAALAAAQLAQEIANPSRPRSRLFAILNCRHVLASSKAYKAMKTKITVISKFCILPLVIAALSVAGVAAAQDTPAGGGSSLSVKDKMFIKKAAKGGMMEVAMGKLADEKG